MDKPVYLVTSQSVSLVFPNSAPVNIRRENPVFDDVVAAIRVGNWDRVYNLAFPAVHVQRELDQVLGSGNVTVTPEEILYMGQPLNNIVTSRILTLLHDGFDITPMVRFLDRLMKNPSFTAVQELLLFIEASNLPIDEDGYFYAYKRITSDWKDQYTKKIDNSIGATVEMPRNAVDDKRENTCSSGLHFCAYGYLGHYGASSGGRVVIVKIDPADVVSIPSDYNNQKGRCCKYVVVREIELEGRSEYALPEERIEGVVIEDEVAGRSTSGRLIAQIIPLTGAVKEYFDSPSAAAKATGVDGSSISKVLRGLRNSAGGFGWAYAEDLDEEPSVPHGTIKVNINYETKRFDEDDYEDEEWDDDYEDDRW